MEGGEGISLVSLMVGLGLLLKRVKKLEANDAENKKKIDLLERKLDQLNQSRTVDAVTDTPTKANVVQELKIFLEKLE